MKTFKLMSRLLAVFGVVMVLAASGWGADECDGIFTNTTDYTFTSSGTGTSYTASGELDNRDKKYYYFTAPSAGTIKLTGTTSSENKISFQYNKNGCTSSATSITENGIITVDADTDFNFIVSSEAANQDFSFTLTFTPTSTSTSTSSIDFKCTYQSGLSVFDSTGGVSIGNSDTKIYQGDGNYNIGVAPANLTGTAEQCYDTSGNAHTCVGNSQYSPKINLGTFPEMPASTGTLSIDGVDPDVIDGTKNSITVYNGLTATVRNSVISDIETLMAHTGNIHFVYDGTNPFKIKNLNLYSGTELSFEPGTYYVENFSMQAGRSITISGEGDGSGVVRFLVKNDIQLNGGTDTFNYTGTDPYAQHPEKLFIASYTGNITVQAGAKIAAYLYADNGDVTVNAAPTTFVGAAAGKNVTLQAGVQFYYLNNQLIDNTVCGATYDNQYTCGIFPSVLTSYTHITSNGNNDQACYTADISYPDGELTGSISCNPNGCGEGNSCLRQEPPKNKYTPSFPTNSKSGSVNGSNPTELTLLEYGNLTYGNGSTIHFNPSQTYINNNATKVMLLGDVSIAKSTLKFEPGDYYFDSLTIDNVSNNVILPNSGPVRIFIKNNFSVAMNNLNFNNDGSQNDLFVYVGGDFNSLGNGGGTTSWKAYMYVKGITTLNNNSNNWKIYGGITTEGEVTINGNNPDFIQQGDEGESFGYGVCQMCYGTPVGSNGLSMFGMNTCSLFTPCDMNIPIRNLNNAPLDNVTITELQKSAASFSWGSNYSVVDKNGNAVPNTSASKESKTSTNLPMGFNISTKDYAIVYNAGNAYPTYSPNQDYYQMHKQISFSISVEDFSNTVYTGKYTDENDREYNIQLGQCENIVDLTTYITGPFDAWDTSRDSSVPPTDRNISTKIINNTFHLSLASLNKTNDAYETKQGIDGVNVSIYPNGSLTPISNSISFNANTTAHVNSVDFNVTSAAKEARVGFKLCATYENNITTGKKDYVLYTSAICSGQTEIHDCNATTSGTPNWHICYSSDNFAIRPYAFKVFGQNQYKRAGEDFNLTIKALDMTQANITTGLASDVTGVVDYNESLNSLNLTAIALNETNSSISTSCPHAGTFTLANPTDHFTNGEINASTSYSETGIIDIGVSEKPGSEFALIDADDTLDIDRYITPSSTVYNLDDINQTVLSAFIPYTIQTDANVSSSGNKDWLYMYSPATAADLLNMSAQVNYHIIAKNKQGNTTQNFTKTCFFNTSAPTINGMKKNTTFDMFLDFRLQGSNPVDTNLTFYVKDDMTDSAIWMPSLTAVLKNTALPYQQLVFPNNFLNGESNTSVHFNITRRVNESINPIKVTFLDANTSISWMANPGATNNFVGTTFANKSKNFLYGRTHAPRYRYTGNSGDAKIYYETYCGTDGNKTMLPTGSIASSDSVGWYFNPAHNVTTDGNITAIAEKNALHVSDSAPSNISGGISTTLTYDASQGYPYKTTMLVTPSSWLIYDQYNASASNNDFEVEFYGSSNNWTGVNGAKDSSGAATTQTTTDSDAAALTNKRILW